MHSVFYGLVKMKSYGISIAAILLSANGFAAQVVSGTAVGIATDFIGYPQGAGPTYSFTVDQNIEGDYTVAWLSKIDSLSKRQSTIEPVSYTTDEGMDLYLAEPGRILTAQTIEFGYFSPLLVNGRFYAQAVPMPSTFYLAINTGVGFYENPFAPNRQVFGWAKVQNTTTGLKLLDSAMAYDALGIYVGTTTAVPEPSTFGLAGLGGLFLAAVGRGRRRLPAH